MFNRLIPDNLGRINIKRASILNFRKISHAMSLPIKNVDKNFCSQNFDFVSGKYNPRGGENCEFFFRNFKIFSRKPHLNICNMKKHVTFILYPVCDISSTTEILCIINILAVLTTTLQKFFTIYVTTLEYYSPRIMRGEVKKHRLICLHGWSAF